MKTNEILAVQSNFFTDRLMVLVERPTYIKNATEVFDAVITATRDEAMEFLVGTRATFRMTEVFA